MKTLRLSWLFFAAVYFLYSFAFASSKSCFKFYRDSKASLRQLSLIQNQAVKLLDEARDGRLSSNSLEALVKTLPVFESKSTDRANQLKYLSASILSVPAKTIEITTIQAEGSGEAEVYRVSDGKNSFILKLFAEEELKGARRFVRELAAQTQFKDTNGKSDSEGLHAAQALSAGLANIGNRRMPFLLLEVAKGLPFQEMIYQLGNSNDIDSFVDSANIIGKQIAQFHKARLKNDTSPRDFKNGYKHIKEEHFSKYQLWVNDSPEGVNQVQQLIEKGVVSSSEGFLLRQKIENIMVGYKSALPSTLGMIHGDLKPGNLFFDSEQKRVTLIDLETLAKTWHGLADPIEDIARLHAGLARHGILADLSESAIRRSQEALLRGYLVERGETYSSVKASFDFYVTRYIGVLLRRGGNGMTAAQERRLLGQIMPIMDFSSETKKKIEAIWSLESKTFEDVEVLELPVSIKIGRESAASLYLLARKNWEDSFDSNLFQEILKKAQKNRTLKESDLALLKSVRKQSRWVRTSFLALDSRHAVPGEIHQFVKILGDLCDALENKVKNSVDSMAKDLLAMTRQRGFERSLNLFRPSTESGISDYVETSFKNMLKLVGKKSLSVDAFHDLRKDISRLQQVLKLVYISNSSLELKSVMDYVNVLNRITRKIHDSFVSESLKGKIDYNKSKVKMPAELPEAIKTLLDRLEYGQKTDQIPESLLNRLEELLSRAYEDYDVFDIPESITLSLTKKDAKEMFDIAYLYWEQTFDKEQVLSNLNEVIGAKFEPEKITADQKAYLKSLRKKAMVLRYLFMSLDVSHQSPKPLEYFIIKMGKLNDSLANGTSHAENLVVQIRDQLKADYLAASIKKFKADSSSGIHEYLQNLVLDLQRRIRSTKMEARAYHEIRKDIRQLQGVLRLVQVIEPTRQLNDIIIRMHKLNERTGQIHDEIVTNNLRQAADYDSVTVVMPAELAYELDRIIGVIEF